MPRVRSTADLERLLSWFNELTAMRLLSARCVALEPGTARLLVEPPSDALNPNGAVNGAIIAGAADLAAGIAVASSGPADEYSSTTDLSVHFLAAARSLPLAVEAEVMRRGRRACVAHVRVRDQRGDLCAVATGTWMLQPGSPHAPPG
jgi:uncharacterized protein (TIGR00369 family)